MITSSRRTFLKVLGASGAAAAANQLGRPLMSAFADPQAASTEFFVFVLALGGWDVTLCTDPRWEKKGLVNPASTLNTTTDPIRGWTNDTVALDDG